MYRHIDVSQAQSSKYCGQPCGDVLFCERTVYHTTIVCMDGLGSGIKAHVAAHMNTARIIELLRGGQSLREAFTVLVNTVNRWRDNNLPFTAFTLLRILNDGAATILTYENPYPILITRGEAIVLPTRALVLDKGVATEAHCHLSPGDGIVLFTDGITQSGIGTRKPLGWSLEEITKYVNILLGQQVNYADIARLVHDKSCELDSGSPGDDRTVVFAHCRNGSAINVFTGPPCDIKHDNNCSANFMRLYGKKIICGATTAGIVAKYLDKQVTVDTSGVNMFTPPKYFIEGVDLVTEGVVTLNQVYNLLDDDLSGVDDTTAAVELARQLQQADLVRFCVGNALNPANEDIVFKKQGILQRNEVAKLIAEKLKKSGKTVSVYEC